MSDIIIVGYPKSGNTWVTRLVAELVGCPVTGFWNEAGHPEIACEGLDRVSSFRCYKSHHSWDQLQKTKMTGQTKVIYVIRDPRDIAISGAYNFRIDRWPQVRLLFQKFPLGIRVYRNWIHPILTPLPYRLTQMIRAVLYGAPSIHPWLGLAWTQHCQPYLQSNHFFIQYEHLLDNPEFECQRILKYLELFRTAETIRSAIQNQSFRQKQASFRKSRQRLQSKFLQEMSGRLKAPVF